MFRRRRRGSFGGGDVFSSAIFRFEAPNTGTINDDTVAGRVDYIEDTIGGNNPTQSDDNDKPTTGVDSINSQNVMEFDGSSDWLDTGVADIDGISLFAEAGQSWTVTVVGVWDGDGYFVAKAGSTGGNRTFGIFNQSDAIKIIVRGTENILTSTTDYNLGESIAITVTWDGATMLVYSDGQAPETLTVGTAAEETSQNIIFGARTNGGGFFLDGSLGSSVIWGKALSLTEVKQVHDYYNGVYALDFYVAMRVVFFGASLTDGAFKAAGNWLAQAESRTGKRLLVSEQATAGWDTEDLKDNIDTLLAAENDPSTEFFDTYSMTHIGGNDVSTGRPYSTDANLAALTSDLEYIMAAIDTKGFKSILANISFRDYDGTTAADETAGSLPYNTNIVIPEMVAAYQYSNDSSWFDPYELFFGNYDVFLDPDNIHGSTTGYQAWRDMMTRIVYSITSGATLVQQLRATAASEHFVVSFGHSDNTDSSNINFVTAVASPLSSVIDTSGATLSGVSVAYTGDETINVLGADTSRGNGTDATATIENDELNSSSFWMQGAGDSMVITVSGLTANADAVVKFTGSRTSGNDKGQLISITGAPPIRDYQANQDPIDFYVETTRVDENGEIAITILEDNNDNTVYICGFEIQVF